MGGDLGPAAGAGGELEWFVRCEQADPGLFEAVFDPGAVVGAPGDAVDGFADHVIEATAGGFGFGEQVLDSAVAGNVEVELFVRAAAPANVEIQSPGLDVVEMRDDQRVLRQRCFRGPQLTRQ
ncbi:hypothetical protein [Nocardia wallacei]|uniref:hypothetical protein n=1 Tax=Nocardia wallacei TaxID=480035 RepID=UPI002456B715|nr:hypothetical protein [Nocardia wallacei]